MEVTLHYFEMFANKEWINLAAVPQGGLRIGSSLLCN
jgi:hypothetical protein